MNLKKILFFIAAVVAIVIIAFNGFSYWRPHKSPIINTEIPKVRAATHKVAAFTHKKGREHIVCPEHYAGPKHESETKWVTDACDYAVPIPKLVTIILLDSDIKMASAIQSTLPGVAVIVQGDTQKNDTSLIKIVKSSANATTAEIWNKMISSCDTPYALLAVNVLNFSMNLETLQRLVRVLSETEGTKVVGGATRNATGHWRAGCYQMALKNYVLTYTKGYHESTVECMRCDFVDGPFLAETSLLKNVTMAKTLPAKMLLLNFFLKVFHAQNSLLCPDVMFDVTDFLASDAAKEKHHWKALATKWQLNRVHIRFPRSAILHKFNCSEVGLKCEAVHVKLTKTLPVCCQDEFARLIDFWVKFADEHGITYQFLSGSILGAVKMADVIPWDIDGDMIFDREYFKLVEESIGLFKNAGIKLNIERRPSKGEDFKSFGYFRMVFSEFFIEMYAVPLQRLEKNLLAIYGDNSSTTLVEIRGVWVAAPTNPGLYARELYGVEILKHAMSWRHTGKKSYLDPYDAGHFSSKCDEEGHHACLNAMPADGSLAFNIPEY